MYYERDAKYHYNDNQITINECIKLTHCTPYIYTLLYVKYIQFKKMSSLILR